MNRKARKNRVWMIGKRFLTMKKQFFPIVLCFPGLKIPPKFIKFRALGAFLGLLAALGALWGRSGPTFGTTLVVLGSSWSVLGRSWALWGASWTVLWAPWAHLGTSWVALGTVLGCLGGVLGSFRVLSDCLQVVQGVHTHNPQKPKENYGFSTISVSPGLRNPTKNR